MYGTQGSQSGSPSTQLNATSLDVPSPGNCDLLFGNPTSPECQPTESESATCSKMGLLSSGGNLFPWDFEEAYTRVKWTGGGGIDCSTTGNKIKRCNYPIVTWCTADHVPPDWTLSDHPYMNDSVGGYDGFGQPLPPVTFGWDAAAPCVRLKSLRGTGAPWTCTRLGISIIGDLDDPMTAEADCTYNP